MRKLRPESLLIAVLGAGLWSAVYASAGFTKMQIRPSLADCPRNDFQLAGSADGFHRIPRRSYHLYKNITPVSIGMWACQFQVKIDLLRELSVSDTIAVLSFMYIPDALVMRLVLGRLAPRPPSTTTLLDSHALLSTPADVCSYPEPPSREVVAHRSRPLPHGDYPGLNVEMPDDPATRGVLFTAWALRLVSMATFPCRTGTSGRPSS